MSNPSRTLYNHVNYVNNNSQQCRQITLLTVKVAIELTTVSYLHDIGHTNNFVRSTEKTPQISILRADVEAEKDDKYEVA
jgi:hypothetical protein